MKGGVVWVNSDHTPQGEIGRPRIRSHGRRSWRRRWGRAEQRRAIEVDEAVAILEPLRPEAASRALVVESAAVESQKC